MLNRTIPTHGKETERGLSVLIADSGSTKTDWLLVGSDGTQTELHTAGINPARDAQDTIHRILYHELLTALPNASAPDAVCFYGAGCIEPFCKTVRTCLEELFHDSKIEVESDLLGAARALLADRPGIACILGTGSNSCLYDGHDIVMHTPPLGFILGDEGSGSYLGKVLLTGLFKGTLPATLREDFVSRYNLTPADIIERVYRQPAANAFLASLVPFIAEHRTHPAIHGLLTDAFRTFLRHNIAAYGHSEMPINCVGGIAFQFETELKEAAQAEGMEIGKIMRRPIEAMSKYHAKRN